MCSSCLTYVKINDSDGVWFPEDWVTGCRHFHHLFCYFACRADAHGWIAHRRGAKLSRTYPSPACRGFLKTEGNYHIYKRSSDELIIQAERVESRVYETEMIMNQGPRANLHDFNGHTLQCG